MCLSAFTKSLLAAVAAAGVLASLPAVAADQAPVSGAFAPPASTYSEGTLTIGNLTPTYGQVTLGVSPVTGRVMTGFSSVSQVFGIGLGLTSPANVGTVGIFAGVDTRPSILTITPATSWTFGASVGYAGFYVRGGVNESTPTGPLLGIQGLQAGFGYEIGALDFRVTYLTSQSVGLTQREIENRQFSLGGIYKITPRIRVNADAFYGLDGDRLSSLAITPSQTSPLGTGARVGVELRF